MSLTKDGFYKQIAGVKGDNTYLLLAGGGHQKLGNASGNVPISNGTLNVDLNADKLDGVHLNGIFTDFSGGAISSSGNTLTQANHTLTIGGITKSAGSSTANIINSLSVSKLTSSNATNLTVGITVNGKASADKTLTDLIARQLSQTSISSLSTFTNADNLIYAAVGGGNSITDRPTSVDAFGVFSFKTASGWYGQLLISSNSATGIYWRTATSLSGGWKKLLDSSNYTDYVYSKSDSDDRYVNVIGDTMTGTLVFNYKADNALIRNTYGSTVYNLIRNHNNGNISISASSKGLYIGYENTTEQHFYTSGTDRMIIDSSGNVRPAAANTYILGSSSYRWKALYIGTADSYGSATKPIYWNAGVPTACTYELKATVNDGAANRMAYYSGANAISQASSIYASTTALSINKTSAPANSGNFQVVGTSTMRHIYPESNNTYNLGSTSLRWANVFGVLGNYSGQVTVSVATGTAPFAITSTTKVNNLNVDLLDGYHAGVQNGQVSIFVPWPSISTMQSEGLLTTNYGTSGYGHPDEIYLQAICKWAIAHYTNLGDVTLIGSIAPNSSGTCIMHLYSSSGKDSTTLLPRYCASTYQTLSGPIYEFGCINYTWYYRKLSVGNADSLTNPGKYYWANIPMQTSSDSTKVPTFGGLYVINDSSNNSYDGLGYFRAYTNNDWGLIVDKSQSYTYGVDIRAGGAYALKVGNGNTRLLGATIIGADATPSYTLDVRGTIRATSRIYANEWIEFSQAYTGLYWPNGNNASHFHPNDATTYGNFVLRGSRGGYSGITMGRSANYMTIMDNGTDKGLYNETNGRWIIYYNRSNNRVSLYDSSVDLGYGVQINNRTGIKINSYPSLHLYRTDAGETSQYFSNNTAGWAIGINPWGVGAGVFAIGQYSGTGSSTWRFKIDNNGYCYTNSYLNLGAGNEKNASNPPYVLGFNGSDTYIRSYQTGYLNVNYANYSGWSHYLAPHYDGGDRSNPQQYFNYGIGVKVAMARYTSLGGTSMWADTLWINGYTGGDVPNMCALTFARNASPRFFISTQSNRATSYGTYYEVASAYNTYVTNGYGYILGNYITKLYPVASNPDNSHPGYGCRVFYSWNTGQAGNGSSGYSNGITIGSHPNDQAYGFQIVQNMWDDKLYFRRYNGGWQSWRTCYDNVYHPNADYSSTVAVNNSDANSTYRMVWHSGNTLYSTGGIYCNPSSDYLYASSFYCGNWFRSSGQSGWYNESYGGGIWMKDSSWIRTYGSKHFYVEGGNFAVSGNAGIGRTSMSYRLDVQGDSYTRGWARADSGFYCEGNGVHYTHLGTYGEIYLSSNNVFNFTTGSWSTLYFNYGGSGKFGGTWVSDYVWYAGSTSSWANHTMGHLSVCATSENAYPNYAAIEVRERSRGTTGISHNYANAPRIGFHWGNRYWANFTYFDSRFRTMTDSCGGYVPMVSSQFSLNDYNGNYHGTSWTISGYAGELYFGGNFHIDSQNGHHIYLNYYSEYNTNINARGGRVGIGTDSPSQKLHVAGNQYITGYINLNDHGYLMSGRSTSFNYGYSLSLGDSGNSMGMFSGPGGEEGAVIVSPDTCVIYNSFDQGWGFQVFDKDRGGDLTTDNSRVFGVNQANYFAWSRGGFWKEGSSNSYVLLGGGGHKALSDFLMNGSLYWANIQAKTYADSWTSPSFSQITLLGGSIEIHGTNPFIDFHGRNYSGDYRSRLINWGSNNRLTHESITYDFTGYLATVEGNSCNIVCLGVFDLYKSSNNGNSWKTVRIAGMLNYAIVYNTSSNDGSPVYVYVYSNYSSDYSRKGTPRIVSAIPVVQARWWGRDVRVINWVTEDWAPSGVECTVMNSTSFGRNLSTYSSGIGTFTGQYIAFTSPRPWGFDDGDNGLAMDGMRCAGNTCIQRIRVTLFGYMY